MESLDENQLQNQVDRRDHSAEEEHEDDDLDRGVLELGAVGPGDLPHLVLHFVVESVERAEKAHDRIPPGAGGSDVPTARNLNGHYFVSLCSLCALQRGQYFFHSTRSGCKRLFLSVK